MYGPTRPSISLGTNGAEVPAGLFSRLVAGRFREHFDQRREHVVEGGVGVALIEVAEGCAANEAVDVGGAIEDRGREAEVAEGCGDLFHLTDPAARPARHGRQAADNAGS